MRNGIGGFLRRYMDYYNISNTSFAESLGITPKHLSEIINKNIDISDELVLAISLVTDFDVAYILKLENNKKLYRYLNEKFKSEDNLKEYLKNYYVNELDKEGWITYNHKEDIYQTAIDLLKFFRVRNFDIIEEKKKNTLYKKKSDSNDNKILLWLAKCEEITRNQAVGDFNMNNLEDIFDYLKKERNNKLNIDNLIKYFNSKGLYLVVMPALKGTKIRGCARVRKNKPAIYLTTLYKDKASFYYALYHELGHIKKHYNMAKNRYLIDGEDNLEKEADEFAFDKMIPNKIWKEIISSDNIEKKSIEVSIDYNIPMCFIVRSLAASKYISYSGSFYNNYVERI